VNPFKRLALYDDKELYVTVDGFWWDSGEENFMWLFGKALYTLYNLENGDIVNFYILAL